MICVLPDERFQIERNDVDTAGYSRIFLSAGCSAGEIKLCLSCASAVVAVAVPLRWSIVHESLPETDYTRREHGLWAKMHFMHGQTFECAQTQHLLCIYML